MNRLFLYIVAIMILTLYNVHFCQLKPIKPVTTKNAEVKIVQKKSKRTSHIEVIKPMNRDEIIRTKPKRKIMHHDPPQRPQKQRDPDPSFTTRSHTQREIADDPPKISICGSGSIRYGYFYYDLIMTDEIENDFIYEEEQKDYYIGTKFFAGKEFTDEDFPICIKGIEFKYLRDQWIDSNDFPEYMNDKESGEYLVYSINLDAYVIERSYEYPFAVQITFPDYSREIVIYNYDSEHLEADSVYSFEEVITLEKTGYAWLTLGYYDFEYNQFYSAVFSPYLTKQKIFIPSPSQASKHRPILISRQLELSTIEKNSN